MSKEIICEIANRNAFYHLLQNNPGLIIIKLSATWCGPCKTIKPVVNGFFLTSPADVVCADIDVDECFDVYSMLKNKKMVNGIPALLCYKKGNTTFIPDDMVTGAEPTSLHAFFSRCNKHLTEVRLKYPRKMDKNGQY